MMLDKVRQETWQSWLAEQPAALLDRHGRSKHKLRISVTDRCNFRCDYCMPDNPQWLPRDQVLSLEELSWLAELFVTRMGIRNIRITGGEPLMRKGVHELVAALQPLRERGLERVSMTSNGTLLAHYAEPLRRAGLDDINVSLDALDPGLFRDLTRGEVAPVLDGLRAARDAGLPVKLNAVIIRGRNEQEVLPLARWACEENMALRFIEFMPLDAKGGWQPGKVVPEAEIIERLQPHFDIERLPRTREPATYYRLDGRHKLGVISTVSNPFCASCDRVRLTVSGEIFPCLFSPASTSLKEALRQGEGAEQVESMIREAVWHKGEGFVASAGYVRREAGMHNLGG